MSNTERLREGEQVLRSGTRPNITAGGGCPQVSAREALAIGRQAVSELGWIQGQESSADGVCLVGGMVSLGSVPRSAFEFLAKAVDLDDWRRLDEWNDTPGRTVADILDAYTMAEKLAREDELRLTEAMGLSNLLTEVKALQEDGSLL